MSQRYNRTSGVLVTADMLNKDTKSNKRVTSANMKADRIAHPQRTTDS